MVDPFGWEIGRFLKSNILGNRVLNFLFAGFLMLLASRQASAFDEQEHERLGDIAVKAVIQLYQCDQSGSVHGDVCKVLKQIDSKEILKQNDKKLKGSSYGNVVACVDYFLTPEKLLAQFDESGNHMISDWPEKKCYEPRIMIDKLIQASHANHTHFQKELLVSLDTYHQLALSIAKNKNRLAGALFVNAIGDHYLQDFFAPGHITTRRSQITDLFANALHDAANERGATLHQGKGDGLLRIQKSIIEIQRVAAGDVPDARTIRNFLAGDENCLNNPDIFQKEGVFLEGDGRLERAGGCGQRIVMLAANVISIEDVLSAAENSGQENYFDDYDFKYIPAYMGRWWSKENYQHNILANLPFGYYALGKNEFTTNDSDRNLPSALETVWAYSFGKELFITGAGVARTTDMLEFVPWGRVGDGWFSNYGVAAGAYRYWVAEEGKGYGYTARVGFIKPETETTLSFGARRTHHLGNGFDAWGSGWSIRLDQGYSSFLSLYLSYGRDYSAEPNGQLDFGTYLSAGVMIAAPCSRNPVCPKSSWIK